MKYGIFSSCPHALAREKEITYGEALSLVKEVGIGALEADSGEFESIPTAEYKALLAEKGMRMFAVHHSCHMAAQDDEIYKDALESCITAAENAAAAGAEYFMIVPAQRSDISDDETDKQRALARIIEGLNALSPEFIRIGIIPAIENFSTKLFPFSTSEEIINIADNVPGLALTYDIGNFRCIGADCIEPLDSVGKRAAFYHVKDWSIVEENGFAAADGTFLRGATLGSGCVPVSELFYRLKTSGYNGWIIFEQEAPLHAMSACLNAMQKYI